MIVFHSCDKSSFNLKTVEKAISFLSKNPEIIIKICDNKFYKQRVIKSFLNQLDIDNDSFNGKCCLITGAMGGVGRRLLEYLAHQGVSKIIMLGRSKLNDKDQQYIDLIKLKTQVNFSYFSCDVGKYEELKSSLKSTSNQAILRSEYQQMTHLFQGKHPLLRKQ